MEGALIWNDPVKSARYSIGPIPDPPLDEHDVQAGEQAPDRSGDPRSRPACTRSGPEDTRQR